jgi:hypothetical protein
MSDTKEIFRKQLEQDMLILVGDLMDEHAEKHHGGHIDVNAFMDLFVVVAQTAAGVMLNHLFAVMAFTNDETYGDRHMDAVEKNYQEGLKTVPEIREEIVALFTQNTTYHTTH